MYIYIAQSREHLTYLIRVNISLTFDFIMFVSFLARAPKTVLTTAPKDPSLSLCIVFYSVHVKCIQLSMCVACVD